MFVRLTSFSFSSEHENEVIKVYSEEITPAVKKQKGIIDVMLLHPEDEAGDHISYTSWKSKEEADAYEASGLYKEMVGKITSRISGKSTLKSYHTKD